MQRLSWKWILSIRPQFKIHFWHIFLANPYIFPTYADVPSRFFLQKRSVSQQGISGVSRRWIFEAISVGNTKWWSKSVATSQPVQSSSSDDLCICLHRSFKIFLSLTKWIALLVIWFRALLAVSQKSPRLRYVSACRFLEHFRIQ